MTIGKTIVVLSTLCNLIVKTSTSSSPPVNSTTSKTVPENPHEKWSEYLKNITTAGGKNETGKIASGFPRPYSKEMEIDPEVTAERKGELQNNFSPFFFWFFYNST